MASEYREGITVQVVGLGSCNQTLEQHHFRGFTRANTFFSATQELTLSVSG